MSDWKIQQMIKASEWPLAPELLAPGADFNARLADGLVPLHWACQQGKAGLVKYMIEQGANMLDRTEKGRGLLELATDSESFQVVMLVIDQLKLLAAPAPDEALRKRLTHVFRAGHPNSRNRLQQTFKDWDRISRKPRAPEAP
jgi:ankyrin repeat protein